MQRVRRNPQRRRGWSRLGQPVLVASLLVAVAVPGALAWGLERNVKKSKSRPPRARCLNQAPTLYFARGVLQRDGHRGWLMDGKPVAFTRETRVTDQLDSGRPAAPREGRIAIISGSRVGGTLIAREVMLLDPWSNLEVKVDVPIGSEREALPTMASGTPQ